MVAVLALTPTVLFIISKFSSTPSANFPRGERYDRLIQYDKQLAAIHKFTNRTPRDECRWRKTWNGWIGKTANGTFTSRKTWTEVDLNEWFLRLQNCSKHYGPKVLGRCGTRSTIFGEKTFFCHLNIVRAGIGKELEIAYIRLPLLLLRIYERESDFPGPYVNKYGKGARYRYKK